MIRNIFGKYTVGGFKNSSIPTLVPKESNAKTFNRFRPISLCISSYAIITNIVANGIKVMLPEIISRNQGEFAPRRQILDYNSIGSTAF